MRSRRPIPVRVLRALLLALTVAQGLGCTTWNPLAGLFGGETDPMRAEMARLEREQMRATREQAFSPKEEEKPKTMEDRLRLGDRYLDEGQLASALWEYSQAHKMKPGSPEPRVRLGYVHLRGEPERARPLFESALEIDPDHSQAHLGLGLALFAAGEREKAISHLERAVALAPDSPRAQEALGVRLDQVGRHDEGGEHLVRALALRPQDGRILNNLGFYHLRAGDYARAEELFRAAIRQDLIDQKVRSRNLGMALAMQGRFKVALEAFRKAGDEQSARNNLGYAHYLRGEHDQAIAEYEKAIVAGGEASVQVVRNLEAAKRALADGGTGSQPAPVAVEPPRGAEVADTDAGPDVSGPPEAPDDDPWRRAPPPAERAE